MNYKQAGVALLILVVLGAGFGWWASQNNTVPQVATETGDKVIAEEGQYRSIEAHYPAERPTVKTAIEAYVAEFKQNANVEGLTAEDIEIQGLGGERKYTLELQYKTYEGSGYTSYVYTAYEDMLGAHPNTYFLTFVFDAQGNQKKLTEVLSQNPNALEELSLIASTQVTEEFKRRAQVDDVTGLIYDEGLSPTEENYRNFYVDGADLVVLFPPYQLAAYAMGSFEARIPLSEMNR